MSIYDYKVKDIIEEEVDLSIYKGKVVLIVNTATSCGFTPQLAGLQALYEKYKDQGFIVLGFPCNQFGKQAKGTNSQISEFCSLKYHTTFPTLAKIDVNGKNASPLFTYIKTGTKSFGTSKIKWNFAKFLINKEGNVVKRYLTFTKPVKLTKAIEKQLSL
jgi:glutathione peroxidase